MKSITVLKLKLKTDPSESAALRSVAEQCRRGRNSASEDWLLRQRGKPESEKQSQRLQKSSGRDDKPKSESTKLYHVIRAATPGLNSQIHATLSRQVSSFLSAKLDWRRQPKAADGGEKPKQLRRRDAILAYDDRVPYFTALEIPLPCSITDLKFGEVPEISFEAVLHKPTRVALSTKRLTTGHKKILHQISAGERKLADARLVLKDDEWFLHLPVMFETEVFSDREAVLWPTISSDGSGEQSDRPFRIEFPDGRKWYIGDGRYLLAQTARLTLLRKTIGWRYRQRMGAGHGRKKIDAATRRRVAQLHNIVGEVRRRAIADIVSQCVRSGCGRLIYREPTGPVKDKCWFKASGIDWDWTRFVGDLTNACARQGIAVDVASLKMKEIAIDAKEDVPAAV